MKRKREVNLVKKYNLGPIGGYANDPPGAFTEARYDEMMEVESLVRVELERSGFDPCPAIKIAQDATAKAWDIWNLYQAEYERLNPEAVHKLVEAARDMVAPQSQKAAWLAAAALSEALKLFAK